MDGATQANSFPRFGGRQGWGRDANRVVPPPLFLPRGGGGILGILDPVSKTEIGRSTRRQNRPARIDPVAGRGVPPRPTANKSPGREHRREVRSYSSRNWRRRLPKTRLCRREHSSWKLGLSSSSAARR